MFKLYESEGCHLCEQAKQMLLKTEIPNWGCELIEITTDDSLMIRFGDKIPVLEHVESQAQLGWPFTATQLTHWLNQQKNHDNY